MDSPQEIFYNLQSMRWESLREDLSTAIAQIYVESPELLLLSRIFPAEAGLALKSMLHQRGLLQPS